MLKCRSDCESILRFYQLSNAHYLDSLLPPYFQGGSIDIPRFKKLRNYPNFFKNNYQQLFFFRNTRFTRKYGSKIE